MLNSNKTHSYKAQLLKFMFARISSHKIHIRNAQLSTNSFLQSSAYMKFSFAKLSSHKIHIRNTQLS